MLDEGRLSPGIARGRSRADGARLAVAVLVLVGAACSGEVRSASPAELASHERMLTELEALRASTRETNLYLGDRKLRELEAVLEGLEDRTTKRAALVHFEVGIELGQLGRIDESIEHLLASHRILDERFPRAAWPPFSEDLAYELGIAYLRKAEDDNCIARYNPDRCLLPVSGDAIHTERDGSTNAVRWLRDSFATAPANGRRRLAARWALNLAAQTLGEYPASLSDEERIPPEVFASGAPFPRFRNVAPKVGLDTFDLCGGAATEDFDGDGLVDVLTSTWDPRGSLHLHASTGRGDFVERTSEAGLDGLYGGLNLVTADYDNDGDVDVYVTRGAWMAGPTGKHPNSLLANRGDGTFLDVTFAAGLGAAIHQTQTAAWADYDLDGDLDLFVGNEAVPDDIVSSQLFRNEGDGTFVDVAAQAGVENRLFAKAATWGDYDGDRYPDLFVSNLTCPNRLYRNRGDGTFENVAADAGVALPIESFTSWFWDYDNDGALDLYVSTYHQGPNNFGTRYRHVASVADLVSEEARREPSPFGVERPRLYRGDGRGGFTDVAREAGVARVTLTMGANFGDLDNDGWLDFYLGTGYPHYDGQVPNVMYRNRGGERFEDVTFAGGFGLLQKGHGVAFCDLDRDGDQDVFQQVGGAYPGDKFGNVLFENPGFGKHWLEVRLVGVTSNRMGLGARICARFRDDGRERAVYRHVGSGGSFGCSAFAQHVGLGSASVVERLEVFWPVTGETQVFEGVPADRTVVVTEHAAELETRDAVAFRFGA